MQTKQGEERRRQILDHARGTGHIEVSEVAVRLDIAAETVRRDLKVLEDHGLVRRIHGAAHLVEGAGSESDLDHRSGRRVPEKRRIAVAAVDTLGEAETVDVDEGFTSQLVADELSKLERPLTVVTPSLQAAGVLAGPPDHHPDDLPRHRGDRPDLLHLHLERAAVREGAHRRRRRADSTGVADRLRHRTGTVPGADVRCHDRGLAAGADRRIRRAGRTRAGLSLGAVT